MPAISHSTGQFLDRRMTSSEGVDLLQELLCQCGVEEEVALSYTTHSLKRTILHWATCSKIFHLRGASVLRTSRGVQEIDAGILC